MSYHEAAVVGFKVCGTCGESKHVLAFCADHSHADGLRTECRDCARVRNLSWARKNAKPRSPMGTRSNALNLR